MNFHAYFGGNSLQNVLLPSYISILLSCSGCDCSRRIGIWEAKILFNSRNNSFLQEVASTRKSRVVVLHQVMVFAYLSWKMEQELGIPLIIAFSCGRYCNFFTILGCLSSSFLMKVWK